jgi:hypothetical protein
VIGNDRNTRVRVPVSEKRDLFECYVKIVARMDDEIEWEMELGFARAQIIGFEYRSHNTKICRAQYFSNPFPEQSFLSDKSNRKGTLPHHGSVSNPVCKTNFVMVESRLVP